MKEIKSGNLDIDQNRNPNRNGWFIGHFIDKDSPFNSDDFEIKWGNHSKGIIKPIPGANKAAKSMAVLVKGKLKINFFDKSETILSKPGDYVYWGPGVYHSAEALEDVLTITIRWPSIPNDQELLK